MKRIILAALLVAACNSKKEPPATGSASGSAPAVAGSGSGSGSATAQAGSGSGSAGSAAAADVPTEQDFEDEASKKIDEKNVEAQVKAIEQDLGSGQ